MMISFFDPADALHQPLKDGTIWSWEFVLSPGALLIFLSPNVSLVFQPA